MSAVTKKVAVAGYTFQTQKKLLFFQTTSLLPTYPIRAKPLYYSSVSPVVLPALLDMTAILSDIAKDTPRCFRKIHYQQQRESLL